MSAGGAQGLEFGPFPQNLPRIKRRTEERAMAVAGPDIDLIWNRKIQLVRGFYQIEGNLILVDTGGLGNLVNLTLPTNDTANQIMTASVTLMNITIPAQLDPAAWIGDGATPAVLALVDAGASYSARIEGVMFVPDVTDCALNWTPLVANVELEVGSYMRLQLIR